MDSTELLGVFRDEVIDVAEPYLWSNSEVYRYVGGGKHTSCSIASLKVSQIR